MIKVRFFPINEAEDQALFDIGTLHYTNKNSLQFMFLADHAKGDQCFHDVKMVDHPNNFIM
jgi:hypothetical protein